MTFMPSTQLWFTNSVTEQRRVRRMGIGLHSQRSTPTAMAKAATPEPPYCSEHDPLGIRTSGCPLPIFVTQSLARPVSPFSGIDICILILSSRSSIELYWHEHPYFT